MSSSNSVTVQILDKEYSIICPQEERNNLVSAARYLDGKMREIRSSGKVIGADRIAVMAALNITHDLLHRQDTPEVQISGSTREQVRDLLERVDLVLATDPDVSKG
ncbi:MULTISPECIES: cell division protein ZapA [unclassified Pseudomonas]|uniref:cell division protein ZapA n=1 Tax=unclassified Pseudomonas TaxID=196821 RepID=UPI0008764E39|nr:MULTISPECIES: cell division protein ZapA [unclassified Pseudomonas]MDB6442096.1 cell division protein ZapA [Pseudomonas sp. 21TX0197]ROO41713.1 cell division protein ZapA [Pseudomonas sp. AF76]ROO42000.1 cell division protein ZapA [Pseudomonas sp. 7SR1]SCX49450.1 cell division protein ZapA [Pseudomonas sp. NFACC32-1]SFW38539.1 cell division protein ZapA [Pseudomonas sp. NFACC09-4]